MKMTHKISWRKDILILVMILNKIEMKQSTCSSFDGNLHVGRRLEVCPIFTMNVTSFSYCMDACLYYTDCLAVNFLRKESYCEMLNVKNESMSPEKFNSSAEYIYMDVNEWITLRQNNPCSVRQCPQGERCIPNKDTYLCREADLCDTKYLVSGPCESVPDSGLTQSTYSYYHRATYARLSSTASWCSGSLNKYQYVQIRFPGLKYIKQIVTLGKAFGDQWVTSFKLLFSTDCITYRYYKVDGTDVVIESEELKKFFNVIGPIKFIIFQGNRDRLTPVINELQVPIKALCVRVNPRSWYRYICMRVDLRGCSA